MNSTFKHLTYDEWIEEHPEVLKSEQKCPECDDGETECPECGSLVTCKLCDGTGKIKSARDEYEFQKRLDDKKMSEYLARIAA